MRQYKICCICEGLRKPSQGEHLLGVTAMMGELPKSILTLSDAGVWRLYLGGGGAANAPPTVRSTCGTFWPKNGSQPHISPRLRCFNRKITQKLCATCITRHLFWLVISPSCCSRQGPPLWNWGNFDHFNPLQTTLNVIWLKKVVPNLPFTYSGKVKKNWQHFPLLFFGESQKYERGGVCRPPRIQ